MDKDKIRFIAVGGATATGKSALALELAQRLGGEIVSCDSMQIYRGMDIGTAKPTIAQRRLIPHHMIDVCDPSDDYSASLWADGASAAIRSVASRDRIPIVCGGTGMYLDALLRPRSFCDGSGDSAAIRAQLWERAERNGADLLYTELQQIDPESARTIHPNNVKRVIRALEIYYTTGITKTESDRLSREGTSEFDPIIINVIFEDRVRLYSRIDRRVDEMMDSGLEAEVRALTSSGQLCRTSTAAQAIGYREMLDFLDGRLTLPEAVSLIKQDSRNYAKRQITWFRRYDAIRAVPDADGSILTAKELCDSVMPHIREKF